MVTPQIDNSQTDHPPLLTVEETANLFRVTTRTLRRWIRIGKVRCLRTSPSGSGRVLIERSEVRRLIESWRQRALFQE